MDGKEYSDPMRDYSTAIVSVESDQPGSTEGSQKKKRGRPRKSVMNTSKAPAPLQDVPGAASQGRNDEQHVDVEKVVTEASSDSFDNQPLSKCFVIDGSTRNMKGNTEASDKSKEVQKLPFDKNPLLWTTIESMGVFQRFPQKPHFRPLEHVTESCREGLAIGYMVTFSSIVDRCCGLQLDDPRSSIEEILETLDVLEGQGFEVQLLRDRLNQILKFKDKKENLEVQSAEIDTQIGKHNEEKTKADEEISSIKKQIAELEQKISAANSGKEAKDVEIASIRSKIDEIKGEIRNVRSEFEDLASKPLPSNFK